MAAEIFVSIHFYAKFTAHQNDEKPGMQLKFKKMYAIGFSSLR
jgi:hypothetical protein